MPGVNVLAHAGPSCALAMALVCAHALECILKAYLSRTGDDALVRGPSIRHDLNGLWSLARSHGLGIPEQPAAWASRLSDLHTRPYHLRYSTRVHGVVLPPSEPMGDELAALLEVVRVAL